MFYAVGGRCVGAVELEGRTATTISSEGYFILEVRQQRSESRITIFPGLIEIPLRSGLYMSRSLQRMVFYNISADELYWNWERSVDGG